MSIPESRVTESVGHPGKWQAQYFDMTLCVWSDIGDATDSRSDAESKRVAWAERATFARELREALELQTIEDADLLLVAKEHPDRVELSISHDGTDIGVTLDTSHMLRIMTWYLKVLAERNAG